MDFTGDGERGMRSQQVQAYSVDQMLHVELRDSILDGFLVGDQTKELEQHRVVQLQGQRQLRLVPVTDLVAAALKPLLTQIHARDQR